MERPWRLDEDMLTSDSVLDGFTFDDIILQLRCNVRREMLGSFAATEIVRREIRELLESRLEDMEFLIENNMDKIIEYARK